MTIKNLSVVHAGVLAAVLGLFSGVANAAPYQGTILDGGNWSLIHEGAGMQPTNGSDDWLRFDPGQPFVFDVSGLLVTASGPQSYSLASNNGAVATFVLESLSLSLDATTGIPSGSMDYTLDGVAGTFLFAAETYGQTVFNSSITDGNTLTVFLWGGDTANDLGIDIGFEGTLVPLPPAVMLFASALIGLAFLRRRNR